MNKLFRNILVLGLAAGVMVGCASTDKPAEDLTESKLVSVGSLQSAVETHLGEDYVATMDIDKEQLEIVYGLDVADIKDISAKQPLMSTHVDTFIAVEANEGKADNVEKALNEYRQTVLDDTMNYPGNIAKVQASKVVRQDDFVFFLMLGKFNQGFDASENDALEFAQNQTQEIEDLILGFFKK